MKNSTKKSTTKSGFTIVETTIVTAFIALLLIAIATIVSNMLAIFQKGVTLNAINNVGRNLISEFNSTINTAPSIDTTSLCRKFLSGASVEDQEECIRNGAFNYIYQEYAQNVDDPATREENMLQMNGIFCTGEYTYMWNTWYGRKNEIKLSLTYLDSNKIRHDLTDFNLIRFEDKTYRACQQRVAKDSYNSVDSSNLTIDMSETANENEYRMQVEPQNGFVESSEANLYLYELVIFPVSQDVVTQRAFFSGTFILGTGNGDATITRVEDTCDPNDDGRLDTSSNKFDLGSKFNYCGINKFNFAARTAGSGV